MFNTKDYILIGFSVITSIVANWLTDFSLHLIYCSIILLLIVIIYILNSKINLMKYIGIKRIEKNISNGTNTEKLLSLTNDSFFLSGRGGSRFIEAQNFQEALSRTNRRTPVRFLILKPESPAPEMLSDERSVNSSHISDIVSATLKSFEEFKSKGFNIEARSYDNPSYIPIFRIVCIDDKELYVSYYQRRETGKNSFQLVLQDSKNSNNLYVAFREHFESLWAISKTL